MKKILVLSMLLLLFAGCESNNSKSNNPNENETKNNVVEKVLTSKEVFNLNLKYPKPKDIYIKDNFVYCKGDNSDFNYCDDDYKEYTTYDVEGTKNYQTAHVLFDSARIVNNQLISQFYIFNWEQQGEVYCNGKTWEWVKGITMIELAKEKCTKYTYTFDIVNKDNEIQYVFNNII